MSTQLNRKSILEMTTPFTDIGESAPKISERAGKFTIQMVRDGRPLKIVLDSAEGKARTTWGSTSERNYASISAMLASEVFANLRRWADSQRELLNKNAVAPSRLIPVNGNVNNGETTQSVDAVDALLGSEVRPPDAVEILLIDGPAGIGKTNLIEQLARGRATTYRENPRPLILHVKSRGRVLSNLQDLMAFSLQTIRSNITYDQLPVLAKHGLIILAIDGFDELGDPNGYELAWAQLGELVTSLRGSGTMILSGRDTFIGRDRLVKDVNALRNGIDVVTGLTLKVPTVEQAKTWLRTREWNDASFAIPAIAVLLEEHSFALRPVFLKLLAEHVKPKQLKGKNENYLTPLLVEHMIVREAKLFGPAVEAAIPIETIKIFIANYLREISRDMADSQSEALDANNLAWISEASLGDGYPEEVKRLIKNRASVIAFLIPDERTGYRTFVHSHLMNYFLAQVTIEAVSKGDFPKYIRRNLLGPEFLTVFVDVISQETGSSSINGFLSQALGFSKYYAHIDRGIRNVGALLIAACPYFPADGSVELESYEIDDSVLRGTSGPGTLRNVVINQLDCRGADLSALVFQDSSVLRLIADDSTRFPETFPTPISITDGSGGQISEMGEMVEWIDSRGRNHEETISNGKLPVKLTDHPVYKLLGRACRFRQYWLRAEDDPYATRVLSDEYWPLLRDLLREHNFLKEENRQASGKSSSFVHIKQKERLLAEDANDKAVLDFFTALESQI
jgi:hypothetical protein